MTKLSIVATVYNDAQIVPILVENIVKNIPVTVDDYEIILVNDFSPDKSELAIKTECNKNPKVKGISLSRNCGQQIAMSAGMNNSTGDYVVIMDGDMQNPPSEIPRLLNEIVTNGYDIVYATSKKRNNWWDSFTSYLFSYMLTRMFKVNIIKHQLMMKIMTKEFIGRFRNYNEMNRTVDGIVLDISSNHGVIEVENNKRTIGKSNYTFVKRMNLMLDMLISLSYAPLNLLIYLGFFTFLATIIASGYYLYEYFFDVVPSGYTSMQLSIFFFGGLIILILGIIGKYLATIYSEVRQRPLYHIKNTYNL